MNLSENFAFDCSSTIVTPMQDELKKLYQSFTNQISLANSYYLKLKTIITGILDDESKLPTVEQVDVLNADLGQLLVILEEGGINFDNLGTAAFGMNHSGFEFNELTGEIISMPLETINQLVNWVQNSIKLGSNQKYLDSVLILSKLMKAIDKDIIEKMILIIDSITASNTLPLITIDQISKDLESVGLSFNEDPNISYIDPNITPLFVQKHLVTTKLYSAIEKQLFFLGGYDPDLINSLNNTLNTPFSYGHY